MAGGGGGDAGAAILFPSRLHVSESARVFSSPFRTTCIHNILLPDPTVTILYTIYYTTTAIPVLYHYHYIMCSADSCALYEKTVTYKIIKYIRLMRTASCLYIGTS